MEPLHFELAGTGVALPAQCVSSDSLDAERGAREGALRAACGVATRYVCAQETQDGLAAQAAQAAMDSAGLRADEIDLIIFGAAVGRQPIPSTAPLIARRLGVAAGAVAAFDVNSTCLSFLTGLDVAASMMARGRFRAALVVAAEIASRALPWAHAPHVAGLFGDGAAAAVLRAPAPGRRAATLKAVRFETYPEGYELCQLASGGTRIDYHRDPAAFAAHATFQMDGHGLFRLTTAHFPAFVARLLEEAGWCAHDVDVVIPHQASPLALAHLTRRCGFAREKVVDIVADYGNQIAASLPTALHIARATARLPAGAKALLLGTSAGVSFGGAALEF